MNCGLKPMLLRMFCAVVKGSSHNFCFCLYLNKVLYWREEDQSPLKVETEAVYTIT